MWDTVSSHDAFEPLFILEFDRVEQICSSSESEPAVMSAAETDAAAAPLSPLSA